MLPRFQRLTCLLSIDGLLIRYTEFSFSTTKKRLKNLQFGSGVHLIHVMVVATIGTQTAPFGTMLMTEEGQQVAWRNWQLPLTRPYQR
jgi:hypothetical protein